jgi:nucleoside-diphosphate-sugar epimerase
VKQVLVTGAGGFIGQHLVDRLLEQGSIVRALVRPGANLPDWGRHVDVVEGDIHDFHAMNRAAAGVDTVFHLAGKTHALSEVEQDEAGYHNVNVDGTRNVLEGAVARGVSRVVFFSSVKAMGEETEECLDESGKALPSTAYGRSKLAAERLVLDCGKRAGLHVVCLRLPLVYGPGNKGNLFRMIAAIDRGFFPPLPPVRNRRSMVHVTNVVEAALLTATSPAANGQCYIVTDGRPYSTRELYEKICHGLGKRIPQWSISIGVLRVLGHMGDAAGRIRGKRFVFDSDALEKLIGSAWYSSDKLFRELGYRPSITFEGALPELVAWYRKAQA